MAFNTVKLPLLRFRSGGKTMDMSNLRKQEGDIADAIFYVKEAIYKLNSSNDSLYNYYTEALYNLHAAERQLRKRRIAEKLGKRQ